MFGGGDTGIMFGNMVGKKPYNTYLCVGTFTNENEVTITKSMIFKSTFKYIKKTDWEKGSVNVIHLKCFLGQEYLCHLDDIKRKQLKDRNRRFPEIVLKEYVELFEKEGEDLFLMESMYNGPNIDTLVTFGISSEMPDHDEPKYILVKKNYSYKVVDDPDCTTEEVKK